MKDQFRSQLTVLGCSKILTICERCLSAVRIFDIQTNSSPQVLISSSNISSNIVDLTTESDDDTELSIENSNQFQPSKIIENLLQPYISYCSRRVALSRKGSIEIEMEETPMLSLLSVIALGGVCCFQVFLLENQDQNKQFIRPSFIEELNAGDQFLSVRPYFLRNCPFNTLLGWS